MQILKKKVKSICPICYNSSNGKIIQKNNLIILKKKCKIHGISETIIETDVNFYKAMINKKQYTNKIKSTKFTIPITKKCNLKCDYCYYFFNKEKDLNLKKIKKLIKNYKGTYISLSGGEPTLKNDLFEIIKFIKKNKQISNLSTNGILLENEKFVKKLKKAGLNMIHFSLNSLDKNILKNMHNKDILNKKIKALKNIKKNEIGILISFLLEKNNNENDLKKITHYCLNNNPFVSEIRIRTTSPTGKYNSKESYYMSEMVELICKIFNISKNDVIQKLKKIKKDKKYCNINIDFLIEYKNKKINTIGWSLHTFIKKYSVEGNIFKLLSKNKITKNIFSKLSIIKYINNKNPINFVLYLLNLIKFKKNLKTLRIGLRVWPNEHTLDLDLINMCPSETLNYDNKKMKFCLSHIYNNAKIKGKEKNFLK
ncbi:radical SAM protein [Candidatus Woesearchaeota archaeon]|jgi:molybdenum cofactor biosynthesis enzyme MoaA|nr:radical SAM protein [Candidatus Woesearchaeota archaeon]